ncbi:MAG: hypothetical protein AAGU77_05925 [Bacillota bacterium]
MDYNVLLTAINLVATLVFAYYKFHKEYRKPLTLDRFNYYVSPAFLIMEPVLYKKIDVHTKEAKTQLEQLVNREERLAGGKIKHYLYLCSINPKDQGYFNALCTYTNHEYDVYCRNLGIPLRPLTYRLNHRQHKTILPLLWYVLTNILLTILLLLSIIALLTSIYRLLFPK